MTRERMAFTRVFKEDPRPRDFVATIANLLDLGKGNIRRAYEAARAGGAQVSRYLWDQWINLLIRMRIIRARHYCVFA